MTPPTRRKRVSALLDRVGIGAERRLQLRKFSKGMMQRVGIAQALLNDPEVIFLDEPMSGLDPLGRRDVRHADPRPARSGPHGLLQLAHPGRRRGALQPRRGRRRRPAGGDRAARRHPGVRGARLGAGDDRRRRRTCSRGSRRPPAARPRSRRAATRSSWRSSTPPERVLADLIATGATLVSLNPLRDTLEDFFVQPRRRGRLGPARVAGGRRVRAISCIAVSVFRESVRDRVPYNLVLFAVLLIASSFFLGQLTAGQDVKIIKDLGLAATAVFGLFIAIFIGIGLVSKEVERRSIYALLAKPISRPQFIPGKYAGLVLTLAVNVAVMTVALYAVLAYMTWTDVGRVPVGLGRARASIRRCSKAVFLIFVELMLVTALALFFSTFSTPLLSAALTFGLYIAGHFNADLRNFEQVVDSKPAAWLARGALSRAAGPVRLRRQDAGRARPAGAGRLRCADDRLRLRSTSRRCCSRRSSSSRGGTSSDGSAASTSAGRQAAALHGVGARRGLASAVAPAGRARSRSTPAETRDDERMLYVRSGEARQAARARFRCAGGGRLLDPRDSALRRRSPVEAGAARKYELLFPLLDLTTTLDPYFTIAYRFGAIFLSERYPGGPGRPDQAIALLRKASPRSRRSGSTTTTSPSCTTGTCATSRPRRSGSSAPPTAGCAELAAAAGGHDAERRQRSRVGAVPVAADSAVGRGVAATNAERSLLQLDALDEIDQLQALVERYPPPPGEPYTVGGAGAARRPARHSRSIRRHALRARPGDRDASRWLERRRSQPMPEPVHAADLMSRSTLSRSSSPGASLGLAIGSFLNVCIHRLPRKAFDRQPAVALPALRLRAALVRQHSGRQLRCCSADAAASAGRRSRSAIRSSSS